MRRFSISDVVISIVALIVVCAAIVPAVARLQRTPEDASCQSNMRRIAEAIQQYTNDWDGRYPTNRTHSMALTSSLPLSPYNPDNPQRFVNSINWVEALYDHIESAGSQQNHVSVWRCPLATGPKFPPASTTAAVTYAFNYNLLEQSAAFNRNREKLMLMREMDRIMDAVCRPINNSVNNSNNVPQSPFLTTSDIVMRGIAINSNLHTQGSHIMFSDGHVAYFDAEYYPSQLTQTGQWDPETRQWWNYVNLNSVVNKAIAITP